VIAPMVTLEATISAAGYIVPALLLGLLVTAGYLLPEGEPAALRRALIANALGAALAFLGISVLALIIQGAKIQHAMPSPELLARYLTLTQSGRVWLARTGYAIVLALILWTLRREAGLNMIRLLAFLALPLVASRSLTSHAVAVGENAKLVVAADSVHLIATALWAGGLPALWRAFYLGNHHMNLPHDWTARLVNRFSRLALLSVALLLITGLYQSWIHVGSLDVLKSTDYGNVLILKLALFIVMLAFGALNFFSTKPRLAKAAKANSGQQSDSRQALRRIGVESVIGLVIFAVTGWLTVLPPGVHAVHQAALTHPVTRAPTSDPVAAEGAEVKILSPAAAQVFSGDQVPLKFQWTKGKRGHHVHAYVNGQLMGMFESVNGTLNGIGPGKHILELRVVAEDHKTELAASDRVEFTVK
jgi:putative copper resistance protein D